MIRCPRSLPAKLFDIATCIVSPYPSHNRRSQGVPRGDVEIFSLPSNLQKSVIILQGALGVRNLAWSRNISRCSHRIEQLPSRVAQPPTRVAQHSTRFAQHPTHIYNKVSVTNDVATEQA
jgi:hypothetical protein